MIGFRQNLTDGVQDSHVLHYCNVTHWISHQDLSSKSGGELMIDECVENQIYPQRDIFLKASLLSKVVFFLVVT